MMSKTCGCPFVLLGASLLSLISSALADVHSFFHSCEFEFEPKRLRNLNMGQRSDVNVRISAMAEGAYLDNISVRFVPGDPWIVYAIGKGKTEQNCSLLDDKNNNETTDEESQITTVVGMGYPVCFSRTFTLEGVFLGKTTMAVSIDGVGAEKTVPCDSSYKVWVIRSEHWKNAVFIIVLTVLLAFANFGMGCELDLAVVKAVISKPIAPFIGLVCQFVVMPLLGYGLAHALFVPAGQSMLALGIFTAGCSPGGGASNMWTVLLEGNLNLSVTMTAVSTLAALVTMPSWLYLLGRQFLLGAVDEDEKMEIHVPYRTILFSLLILICPLVVGVMFRRWRPAAATSVRKVLRPFFLLVIVFVCTWGIYANFYMMKLFSWRVLLAGFLLPWAGFLSGAAAAVLARQSCVDSIAIMVEIGVQNAGIAIVLLKSSFGQPTADLSSVVPVATSLFTPMPMLALYLFRCIYRCSHHDQEQAEQVVAMSNGALLDAKPTTEAVQVELCPLDKQSGEQDVDANRCRLLAAANG